MDGPLIDLGNSAVWRVIRRAKWRGYITYDELGRLLPPESVSAEQIKDVLEQLQGIRRKLFVSEFQLLRPWSQWWRTRCSRAGILIDR